MKKISFPQYFSRIFVGRMEKVTIATMCRHRLVISHVDIYVPAVWAPGVLPFLTAIWLAKIPIAVKRSEGRRKKNKFRGRIFVTESFWSSSFDVLSVADA
jgi:hypothetical protein